MLDFTSADLDFDCVISDIYDAQGNPIPREFGRGAYRSDNDQLMGIVGPHVKPIQHRDVIDPVLQTLHDEGVEVIEREPSRHNLYDLAGQKGAFVTYSSASNGAIMKARIIKGDFIQPTGNTAYLDKGPDTMLVEHVCLNSHNSTLAASVDTRYCRLICMNGIIRPSFSARAYGKHTTHFNVDGFKKQVLGAALMMEQDAELFGMYATTALTATQAEAFIRATLGKLKNLPNGEANFSERLTNELLVLFNREAQTVWGLVQAMTAWATHGDMKSNANEVTGRLDRDGRVATAMRSPTFKALIAA